ncbi:restriction endonuclease subunit S [Bradyrhizobium guangdongense]|uniref:restriction endonuclease subunit S n=1 Tax=Bradyrhizobium guangdongense TaxID=1325090 RepID=UPI001FEE00E0|nr:restriction endonuclease subunit S [Bradyrhizobium guangdongense]
MPANIGDNRIVVQGIARIRESDAARLEKYRVRAGDIVYSRRGDVERRALIRNRENGWLCGTGCLRVRLGENGHNPVFATYYLGHPKVRQWIVRHARGATMANLNTTILSDCPFVIAPADVQRSVAKVLGDLDDKVDLLRGMNRTLEAIAQEVFRAWFVDFEPVRAKAAGTIGFRGMSRDVFDVLPDSFASSEIGELPSGWVPCVLADLIDVNPTRSLRKGSLSTYLGMSDVPTDGPTAESWAQREFSSGMKFKNGDTLLARITPCLENGKTALVDFLGTEEVGWGSTEYIVLAPKAATPSEFIYCLARNERFREFAIKNMTGTSGRQRVDHTSIAGYKMVDPGSALLKSFGEITQPIFKRIVANRNEIVTLVALRNTLLPKLISGELEAPDLASLEATAVNNGG